MSSNKIEIEGAISKRHDTEVLEKTTRRRFTADYKRRIVDEADKCKKPGELGALLRREGLYSSVVHTWRQKKLRGGDAALAQGKRGPVPKRDARDRRIDKLEHEKARLQKRVEQAEALIDLQKKVSLILGIVLPESDERP